MTTPYAPQTAFAATERALRASLGTATFDAPSFARRLTPCSLERCRGTCCYDGVYTNDEEAAVLANVARREAGFFQAIGLDLPERVIVEEHSAAGVHKRTVRRDRPFRQMIDDYPAGFPETGCVLLLGDGRCGLQMLADAKGLHPWHFKPLACWLHPISISPGRIELHDEADDPYRDTECGGFATQTHCGRTDPCGQPARSVLRAELDFLGRILGRTLIDEPDPGRTG